MAEVRVGTCSWADRQLLSSGWYPPNAKDGAERLEYYSRRFDVVELDSPFYAIPDVTDVYRWASWTPPDFLFGVKVYGLFTFHSVQWTSLPRWVRDEVPDRGDRVDFKRIPKAVRLELWGQFSQAIRPLQKIGKLGYLLFQLPPWAAFSDRMLRYLDRVVQETNPFPVAFEVRHGSWLARGNREAFFERLRAHDVAYVVVDEPRLPWTVPPTPAVTASWGAVVRFHGHNREAWSRRGAPVGERFRYLYAQKELAPWRHRIQGMAQDCDRVFAMFNTCWSDYSVRNASSMQTLLGISPAGGLQTELDLR